MTNTIRCSYSITSALSLTDSLAAWAGGYLRVRRKRRSCRESQSRWPGVPLYLQLLPFGLAETPKKSICCLADFPDVVLHPRDRSLWYASYLQTYIERDVRSIANVRDLTVFRRFLSLVASRNGQMLNRTDLAAPLGVSVPTISEWLPHSRSSPAR